MTADPAANGPFFRLSLLRHGHAAWPKPGTSDFDRPLDPEGEAEVMDVAEQALLSGLRPDRIIASPARRCRQTADRFAHAFGGLPIEEDPELYANGEDAYLKHIIGVAAGRLLIVGHNPMIEIIAQQLASAGPITDMLGAGYPTAGLLTIDFPISEQRVPALRGHAVSFLLPSFS